MYDINVNNGESKKRLGYAVFRVCALSCESANVGYQTHVCYEYLIQFHNLDKRILFNDEHPYFSFYAPSVLVQKGVHYVNDRVILCTPPAPVFLTFLSGVQIGIKLKIHLLLSVFYGKIESIKSFGKERF